MTVEGGSASEAGAPVRPPAVWPVLVILAGALLASAFLTASVLYLTPAARPLTQLLLAAGVSSATLVVAALAGVLPWRASSAEELALTPTGIPWLRVPLLCLGLLGLSQAIDSAAVLLGLGSLGAVGEMTRMVASATPTFLLVGVLVIGLGAGWAEEFFFRGFAQTRLVARWGPGLGVTIAALLFGLAHLDLFLAPCGVLLGLYFGWVRHRARSLWPAAAAHAVNNSAWLLLARLGGLAPSTHVALLLLGLLLATGAFAWEETCAARALPANTGHGRASTGGPSA